MASSKEKESNSTPKPLRAFFIPWFASGHMIPMVDIACLFASRGVDSTILVTPANAALINRTVENSASSGLPIRTILYPFPSAETGLPPGIENLASVPQADVYKVDTAAIHARPALESLLRLHRPDAVVADVHFPWTSSVAKNLVMPRLTFYAIGLFPLCVMHSLGCNRPYNSVSDDAESFLVPDLPHPIRMVRPEMPEFFLRPITEQSTLGQIITEDKIITDAKITEFGVIVNSFSGFESAYVDQFYKRYGVRSWFVGPVALAASNNKVDVQAIRGGEDVYRRQSILAWLDKKPCKSVVYLCFGSWCYFSAEQIAEIASGLEKSGHSFLWVVREKFEFLEGFGGGGEKGMVVSGWAPQVEILSHSAVGGFVTHCGWNSSLEGITAGLPMVTWPLSTEQFVNEKMLVDVLRIGVKNWNGFRTTVAEKVVVVNGDDFAAAVWKIMGTDEEAEEMRKRAREYGDMARAAVKEGGSSYNGLSNLIDEIRAFSLGHGDIEKD